MAKTFFTGFGGVLRKLAQFAREIEGNALKFHPATLNRFRDTVRELGADELRRLHAHLVKLHFPQGNLPEIFPALLDRHLVRWERAVNNAFATATDSVPEVKNPYRARIKPGGPQRSILARLLGLFNRRDEGRDQDFPKTSDFPEPPPNSKGGRVLYGLIRAGRTGSRLVRMTLLPYLRLLIKQTPLNYAREFRSLVLQYAADGDPVFLIPPRVQTNSCQTCRALAGRVLTREAVRFAQERLYPPLFHPNCFPGDVVVRSSLPIEVVDRRWYEGQIVVIRTAAGHNLSVTPNHPVMTPGGWVSAAELAKGSEVLCDSGWREGVEGVRPNDGEVPARIEDLFDAFRKSSAGFPVRVPTTAEDFHGDGVVDGDVDVVLTAGSLVAGFAQGFAEKQFVASRVAGASFFDRLCTSFQRGVGHLRAAASRVGGGCLSPPLRRSLASGTTSVRFRKADRCSRLTDDGRNDRLADTVLPADLGLGSTFPVHRDHVVDLSVREFAGHVFNLQTSGGWYAASALIVSNCVHGIQMSDLRGVTSLTYDGRHGELVTVDLLRRMGASGKVTIGAPRRAFVNV